MLKHSVSAPAIATPDALFPDTTPRPASDTSVASASDGVKRLLTVEAMLQMRPRLAPALRASGCRVRTVARWDTLLEVIEHESIAATLVDLDAANCAAHGTSGTGSTNGGARMLSGNRLVSLLARQARDKRFALVVQTALDFAEIEELIHQGVHALIHPHLKDAAVAACITRAMERWAPLQQAEHAVAAPRTDVPPNSALAWDVAGWPGTDNTTIPPAFG